MENTKTHSAASDTEATRVGGPDETRSSTADFRVGGPDETRKNDEAAASTQEYKENTTRVGGPDETRSI
jgi:hypothetical protein